MRRKKKTSPECTYCAFRCRCEIKNPNKCETNKRYKDNMKNYEMRRAAILESVNKHLGRY